jgi:hypothetical protein
LPRRLTPLREGLTTYLGPSAPDASLAIDGRPLVERR